MTFDKASDGSTVVTVRQSVRDLEGRPPQDQMHGLKDKLVEHVFRLRDDRVVHFGIQDVG